MPPDERADQRAPKKEVAMQSSHAVSGGLPGRQSSTNETLPVERGAFGDRLGRCFGQNNPPTLVCKIGKETLFAVTQLRCDVVNSSVTASIPREDAYLIGCTLRDGYAHERWVNGEAVPVEPCTRGTLTIYDLTQHIVLRVQAPFHLLHFYLPRAVIVDFLKDVGQRGIDRLEFRPGEAVYDPVIPGLGSCLLPALDRPDQANPVFVEHMALAFVAHAAQRYGGVRIAPRVMRGGLAPWQERRAKGIIEANLDGEISLAELARECGLSTSHFSRAFKDTTGTPPHQWLLHRRIDNAMRLLRNPQLSLTEVALTCGFADQSHFTRVFTKLSGTGPGAWRRRDRESAADIGG
jgi:AraC-like DNA-binding protein